MKRPLALLSLLILTFCYCEAQPLYLHWTKFIGGTMGDNLYDAIATSDGGIVFTGMTGDSLGLGDIPASPPDTQNNLPLSLVVGKIDSNQQIEWVKIYYGQNKEAGRKIIQMPDGGFAILGYTFSSDGDVSFNRGAGDIWLLRLDDTGNLIWQKTYGSSAGDAPISLAHTSDGGFLIFGGTNGSDFDIPFHYGGQFAYDWFLMKTDNTGTVEWTKTLGGTGEEVTSGTILEVDNSYYLISGSSSHDNDCIDTSWHPGVTSTYLDVYVMKLDTSGNVLWSKSYGGSSDDVARYAIWDDRDSSIVVTVQTSSMDYMVTNKNNYNVSIWVLKVDLDGNFIWGTTLGDTVTTNMPMNILQAPNGGYLVNGYVSSDWQVQPPHIGNTDVFIFELDSMGTNTYLKVIGGVIGENNSILLRYRNGYGVAGTSSSQVFVEGNNLNPNHAVGTDMFVSNLFTVPNHIRDIEAVKSKLVLYPNPASGIVRVILPGAGEGEIRVQDNTGKTVFREKFTGAVEVDINTANWAKGVYIAEWLGEGGVSCLEKLLNY